MLSFPLVIFAGALSLAPPAPSSPTEPAPAPSIENVEVDEAQASEVAPAPDSAEAFAEDTGAYVIVDAAPLEPSTERAPPPVEFEAGAMIMVRPEFRRTRDLEGESTPSTIVPTRLRARFEARARDFRIHASFQEARNLANPIGSPRLGFHQAFGEYDAELRNAHLLVRIGRQEYGQGTRHLFWTAPWGAAMRSWDGARVSLDARRGGFEVFVGSLARPLLSSDLRLTDHVAERQALTWVLDGYVRVREALIVELLVTGGHERDATQLRNIVTSGLRLHGDIAPGLDYEAEGQVQAGEIGIGQAVQTHLAGTAFAELDYLTPKPVDRQGKLQLGAFARFDFRSGSQCETAEIDNPGLPCTSGRNADFHSPWMARHFWYGHADRFWASNVIDGAVNLRAKTAATDEITIDLNLTNHIFAFPEPGGMWRNTGGALIGVDPDNRNPWAAHEADVEGRLEYRWIRFDIGWHLVTHLAGGRAVSGLAQWQRVYFEIFIDF